MACGKTTVAAVWKALGAEVIDSDATVHRLLAEDAKIQADIAETFGPETRQPDGQIDRAKLAAVVFNDENALQQLMDILHPKTRAYHIQEAERIIANSQDAVVDSPLLFESGLYKRMDLSVVVSAPRETQIQRAVLRAQKQGRVLTPEEAEKRIDLQMPLNEKMRLAYRVIENDGTLAQLQQKAEALYRDLAQAKSRENG